MNLSKNSHKKQLFVVSFLFEGEEYLDPVLAFDSINARSVFQDTNFYSEEEFKKVKILAVSKIEEEFWNEFICFRESR